MKRPALLSLLLLLAFIFPNTALAQSYSFEVTSLSVDVFLNGNGTIDLLYRFEFSNDPNGAWIDFVDVGLPNEFFNEFNIQAEINGQPAAYVSKSEYQGSGTGAAVALGSAAIPPGGTGTVTVYVPGVERRFRPDTSDREYASLVFAPTWFDGDFVNGDTDIRVSFHLPPGVLPEEPRWHASPPGWQSQPDTGFDQQGRVTYTWRNGGARADREYDFGASIPRRYLPADAVRRPSIYELLGISQDTLISFSICTGMSIFFISITIISFVSTSRRKLEYLPPKISVEGHGIKRGLTAVEAAILLQQPMDKILTMILFSVIKKGAASVRSNDPLELSFTDPRPSGLNTYETSFLNAFEETKPKERKKALTEMMIDLVQSVTKKMKGFSLKETEAYYKSISEKAWQQVEQAATPEVKMAAYDEALDWTMLDKDYDDRTRRVFRDDPVILPRWWGHYNPTYSGGGAPKPSGYGGGGVDALPSLPGSDFAASMVNSVENFSGGVIGKVSDFTSAVTNKTNPVPVSSRSGSSSSGGGCACACACAGCACACAGGGR
jgi:hypothetical protein